MGKKVREYKAGDFIFAKVKGYPAWPARVQRQNGKKYFVYFYGTGETANLPPNMIFDYAENKDKFLTKTVKRRDFNDGVKQIEHDFANNVPLEDVIGAPVEAPADAANDTANDTVNDTGNDTMDDSAIDTAADDTVADTTAGNTTQNDTAVEDSDDPGALVIDEGKAVPAKGRKSKQPEPKTPAKEAAKTPKTPRGKAKKEDKKEEEDDEKPEEIVSRSGRKIRPKRYIDEQTEDNATLLSPAAKKRRGTPPLAHTAATTPAQDKEKDKAGEKTGKPYNNVSQSELEELKEPFKPADPEKENILIAYVPNGQYVGIKLFQSRPSFKDDAAKLQWEKQAAANAITLKSQLEKGHITPQSIVAQLVTVLNLTDEEKAALDKERETEEKRSRVQFLKTEMKLIELDAKIKTCLCLEKADTELCLKLLDELIQLEIKPLMLLKHPTCLETVKRMRAYVGNTPSWDLSEGDALSFSKQAHLIRKQADLLYNNMKELFSPPKSLSFWEFFSERVLQFKKVTANLSADELLEMVHEPLEMSTPTSHTMQAAIDAANEEDAPVEEDKDDQIKKKNNAKNKKANSTPAKTPVKRQNSRKQDKDKDNEKDKEKEKEKESEKETEEDTESQDNDKTEKQDEKPKDKKTDKVTDKKDEKQKVDKKTENKKTNQKNNKEAENEEVAEEPQKEQEDVTETPETEENGKEVESVKDGETVESEKNDIAKKSIEEKTSVEEKKEKEDEPRAKRSRGENKKTEPPPRSPAKRKTKA